MNQMQMYAMLWWATHDKNQIPDELWYVGAGKRKQVPVPKIEHLEMMIFLQENCDSNQRYRDRLDCPPNLNPKEIFERWVDEMRIL